MSKVSNPPLFTPEHTMILQTEEQAREHNGAVGGWVTKPMECNWTLRDLFAAAALAGMHARDYYDEGQQTPEQRTRLAYIDADAALAAREGGEGDGDN